MNTDEQDDLVKNLQHRREQALETINALEQSSRAVELDQTVQGRLSRMDAIAQQQMAQAGKVNLGVELQRIDAALERARAGRFGICCRCALPIELERLQADPAAPFCIACLEEMVEERRRKDLQGRS